MLTGLRLCAVFLFAFDGDAQGTEEMKVILGEGQILGARGYASLGGLGILRRDVVDCDGGLQHQHHFEAVLAHILDHTGNLLALDDRFMDGFAKLLNQFA